MLLNHFFLSHEAQLPSRIYGIVIVSATGAAHRACGPGETVASHQECANNWATVAHAVAAVANMSLAHTTKLFCLARYRRPVVPASYPTFGRTGGIPHK